MCLGRPKKFLQASEVEKSRKIQVTSTVKLRSFYQYFYVKKYFSIFHHIIRLRYRTMTNVGAFESHVKTNFSMLYIENLKNYKQIMTTIVSGGWMNFSNLGMRVKLESLEKFLDKMKRRGCHE